jgi:secondary thiamine-phosphate synthase enzyme
MHSHPLEIETVSTRQRSEIVDITDVVRRMVRQKNVRDGMAILYVPHTTAAVTINENYDPDVKHDLLKKLETLVPKEERYYQHDEGNSDSHVKVAMVGNSATVIIEGGELVLGRWQGIYFCEFDGPREREVMAKIVDWSAGD